MRRTNWAGNYIFTAPDHRSAASLEDAQAIVAAAHKVRVLGSGHSFNDISDCAEVQLSLHALNRVIDINTGLRQVKIEGGIRYGDLAPLLHAQGWALANLASLPHISVAGAVMTATHGSGSAIGNLATSVAALDILTATGDIVTLSRKDDADSFTGAVVSLGALGVVTALTLDIELAYLVRQDVYTDLPFAVIEAEFDTIFAAGSSVSIFTDWRGDAARAVWVKTRLSDGKSDIVPRDNFFGARRASCDMHPLPDGNPGDCTAQMGQPGPWHERLPHFRMGFAPSHGAEIQAEYFVPRDAGARAIAALRRHGDRLASLLMTSEIRTIAGDDLWLSPGANGPYVGLHFTFRRDAEAVRAVLPAIEADLDALGVVPHWGKVSTMVPATLRSRIPHLARFRDLAQSFDPKGKFRNSYLNRHVFDEP